jgi:hypothetical protein
MNIEILNWLKPTSERNPGRMKKIRGDKSVGVIIHIHMEISKGNSLCSCLYLKQTKISCFSFFFYKIGEQECRAGLAQAEGLAPVGGKEVVGKGG